MQQALLQCMPLFKDNRSEAHIRDRPFSEAQNNLVINLKLEFHYLKL